MKILLTGFEPFGESKENPSEQVIRKLGRQRIEGASIISVLLPVDRNRGPQKIVQSIRDNMPDVVLSLGESSGKAVISIERVAINLLDFRIPDNAGLKVVDEPIILDGPTAYFSTLPVRKLFTRLLEAGIPVDISLSAGAFLCNQVFYESLHFITQHKLPILSGFIHLPSLPEQAAAKKLAIPTMSLETSLSGVREVIRCIIEYSSETHS